MPLYGCRRFVQGDSPCWRHPRGENPAALHFRVAMRTQIASRGCAVSQFAENEHGVADLDDLLRLGFSRSAVKRWAANGHLHRIHRGVYAVGRADLTVHGHWLAAVKACGPGAALSHQTAAALWDLRRAAGA